MDDDRLPHIKSLRYEDISPFDVGWMIGTIERLRTIASAELECEREAVKALRQQLHDAQDIAARNIEERNQLLEQRDNAYVEYVRLCKALGHRPDEPECEQCEESWRPVEVL